MNQPTFALRRVADVIMQTGLLILVSCAGALILRGYPLACRLRGV